MRLNWVIAFCLVGFTFSDSAWAATANFNATLSVTVGAAAAVIGSTTTETGAGVGDTVPGGSASIPGGLVSLGSVRATDPSAFPLTGLAVCAPGVNRTLIPFPVAGEVASCAPLPDGFLQQLVYDGLGTAVGGFSASAYASVFSGLVVDEIPLAPIGVGGTASFSGTFSSGTVTGNPWTTGAASIPGGGTLIGADERDATGCGRLRLVTTGSFPYGPTGSVIPITAILEVDFYNCGGGVSDSDGDGIQDAIDACPADPLNDADGDGLCANVDNCPLAANPDQADADGDGIGNACEPDGDNDGVIDDADNCPLDANANQSDADRDGIGDACDADSNCDLHPELDTDGDGICGEVDNCPLVANPDQDDADSDGLGDVCDSDDDNDGLEDANDNCPLAANANQADSDGNGTGDVCDADTDCDVDATLSVSIGTIPTFTLTGTGVGDSGPGGGASIPSGLISGGAVSRLVDPIQFFDSFAVCAPGLGSSVFPIPAVPGSVVPCDPLAGGILQGVLYDGLGSAVGEFDASAYLIGTGSMSLVLEIPVSPVGVGGEVDFSVAGIPSTLSGNPWATGTVSVSGGLTISGPVDFAATGADERDATGAGRLKLVTTALASLGSVTTIYLGTTPVLAELELNFANCGGGVSDSDGDGIKDAIDACPADPLNDADGDGLCANVDNCPLAANPDQADADGDGIGNACDPDGDNDGVVDAADNCPLDANPDQADADGDGIGNACDADGDGDGVVDAVDDCLGTKTRAPVLASGCSLDQTCPCETPWKNHGAYVRCVSQTASALVAAHAITATEHGALVAAHGSSVCGK